MPAKNEEELDRKIKDLEAQLAGGRLSLIDERKTVEEISKLKRSRKQFSVLDEKQKSVDDLTAKIQAIKAEMTDPKSKELSEKYSKLQTELDAIKAEEDEVWKNINSLRDEKTKLRNEDKAKWEELKSRKDAYFKAKKEFSNWEWEQKRKARDRQRAERERIEKERKLERAQKMLTEASDPAYLDEIRRANSLLFFFDPTSAPEKAPLQASSGLEAQADRKVDDSGIKGVKLVRKEDRGEDYLPAVKKGKKGKKSKTAGAVKDDKPVFKCPPSVMDDCSFMGIEPPSSADDIPGVVEKIKAKLDHWKSDQDAQTKKVSSDFVSHLCAYALTSARRTLKRPRRRSKRSKPKRQLRRKARSLNLVWLHRTGNLPTRTRTATRLSTTLPRISLRRPILRTRRRRLRLHERTDCILRKYRRKRYDMGCKTTCHRILFATSTGHRKQRRHRGGSGLSSLIVVRRSDCGESTCITVREDRPSYKFKMKCQPSFRGDRIWGAEAFSGCEPPGSLNNFPRGRGDGAGDMA